MKSMTLRLYLAHWQHSKTHPAAPDIRVVSGKSTAVAVFFLISVFEVIQVKQTPLESSFKGITSDGPNLKAKAHDIVESKQSQVT